MGVGAKRKQSRKTAIPSSHSMRAPSAPPNKLLMAMVCVVKRRLLEAGLRCRRSYQSGIRSHHPTLSASTRMGAGSLAMVCSSVGLWRAQGTCFQDENIVKVQHELWTYLHNILMNHVVPTMTAHVELLIFQQDNARPHPQQSVGNSWNNRL